MALKNGEQPTGVESSCQNTQSSFVNDANPKRSTSPQDSPAVSTCLETEGEFAGWKCFKDNGFDSLTGPFWYRREVNGGMRCAFRVEQKHLNIAGYTHGGCYMAFADFCLFMIAKPVKPGPGVTTNMACEFIDSAREGDVIVGTGQVTRAGRSLIFVRGQLAEQERLLFTFSGTIKRSRQ
ncbi:PaaI family thioesterase [Bradyrhizobium elkanii]|uniref:PaaI family thioesterase n=1 Tax=Bradyrhizobium elkanii TaxID=29448 RepID=UPI001BABA2A6|nr:PaaI family thioesterase [Bradyrhizobium elkanii]